MIYYFEQKNQKRGGNCGKEQHLFGEVSGDNKGWDGSDDQTMRSSQGEASLD